MNFSKISQYLSLALLLLVPIQVAAAPLTDPLNYIGVNGLAARLIGVILSVVGSIALLMFIWGGFQWLSSAGEPDRVKKGKETLKWAVIGLAVILMAYVMVNAVVSGLTTGTI